MKWRNWLAAIIGIWFIISPWVLGFSDKSGALWTSVIIGAVQLIVAGSASTKDDSSGWTVWQTWLSLITGIWFIIAPYIFALGAGETWTSVILGAVTALLSLWTMGTKSSGA